MTGLAIAVLAGVIWLYLAVGRGGFWRGIENDQAMHDALPALRRDAAREWPHVVAVIPARDEAELVGITVASLLTQRYDGALSVIVVDDHSTDGTAAVATRAAVSVDAADRLTVLAAPALPAGWTGKLWAVSNGVAHADRLPDPPEFLLLTDADIRYKPDAVAALVSSAVETRLVLSSLMVRLRCTSFAERTLIPAFVFSSRCSIRSRGSISRNVVPPQPQEGCVLVRRSSLQDAGGIASIRDALIDDCALAGRLKPQGPIRLALGEHVDSLRAYPSFHDIRRMVVRSAYAQLRFSPGRLLFVVIAMALVFLAPVALAVFGSGWTRVVALCTWALMALLFAPMCRRYRVPAWWSLFLPVIAATYLAFTVESAIQHGRGRGGMWKGRAQGSGSGSAVESP